MIMTSGCRVIHDALTMNPDQFIDITRWEQESKDNKVKEQNCENYE